MGGCFVRGELDSAVGGSHKRLRQTESLEEEEEGLEKRAACCRKSAEGTNVQKLKDYW